MTALQTKKYWSEEMPADGLLAAPQIGSSAPPLAAPPSLAVLCNNGKVCLAQRPTRHYAAHFLKVTIFTQCNGIVVARANGSFE